MRVVFPRELLSSTEGARVEPGDGLQQIMKEESADARTAWLLSLQPLFGLILVVLAAVMTGLVYLRYGRDPKVDYDREYEQGPPTDGPPAVIGAIMDQRPSVGAKEFVATLFDLVRQEGLKAEPASVKKDRWLQGEKTITDLRIDHGDLVALRDYEWEVMDVTKSVLARGPVPLSEFADRIKDDAEMNGHAYERFREAVKHEVERRDLVERGPGGWLAASALVLGLAGAAWFLFSLFGFGSGVIRFLSSLSDSILLALLLYTFFFWLLFLILKRIGLIKIADLGILRKVSSLPSAAWVRRTPKGALLQAVGTPFVLTSKTSAACRKRLRHRSPCGNGFSSTASRWA